MTAGQALFAAEVYLLTHDLHVAAEAVNQSWKATHRCLGHLAKIPFPTQDHIEKTDYPGIAALKIDAGAGNVLYGFYWYWLPALILTHEDKQIGARMAYEESVRRKMTDPHESFAEELEKRIRSPRMIWRWDQALRKLREHGIGAFRIYERSWKGEDE